MRKPACSTAVTISPMWLAATASGLMIVSVRSIDILHGCPDIGRGLYDANAGLLHGADLFRCDPGAPRDDGAGMTHAAAGRSGLAGDEADHWLFDTLPDIGSS